MAPWAHGDVRSLAVEREWDGWDDFFKSGSLMLAAVSFHYIFQTIQLLKKPSPSKLTRFTETGCESRRRCHSPTRARKSRTSGSVRR